MAVRRRRVRVRVHYSTEASERLAAYHRARRGRLMQEINSVAASGPLPRFVRVETARDVAACEVLEDRRAMLVYAVISKRELLRKLWGAEVDEKVRRRRVSELTHGRWH